MHNIGNNFFFLLFNSGERITVATCTFDSQNLRKYSTLLMVAERGLIIFDIAYIQWTKL